MPYTLENTENRSLEIKSAQITSFAIDPQRMMAHLAYELRNEDDERVAERLIVISGRDFESLIGRINEIQKDQSELDTYAAQKQAYYEVIEDREGWSGGTVS